jgi:hypothetical protein
VQGQLRLLGLRKAFGVANPIGDVEVFRSASDRKQSSKIFWAMAATGQKRKFADNTFPRFRKGKA